MNAPSETLRQRHFDDFAWSCRNIGGKHRKVTDYVHACDLTPDLTVELALSKDTLYGSFLLRRRVTSRARMGVSFNQQTITVI
ncbi:MAG: hypothetical protein NZ932_03895 [Candidatus Bathyarchaeota archaeon]|nr:hypothetical protein [Candidatus Bathyarchaeota archaeon]MDW8022389.1 hypothetical protein [Nitrososphaerota archaeon]